MKNKPNILFILTDDQGAWAMHCSGIPELSTPNLDRIAGGGVRFENFFCASPVCSPARASLLTGKMPSAHGVLDWLRSGNVDADIFAAQGKENPYADGYANERKPIAYLDGQTAWTDILAAAGYRCALAGKWHLGDSICPQHGFTKWYTLGLGGCCYYHPDIVENEAIHVEHSRYVTELFTDKALEYMEEFAQGEEPFCLAVHYTAPHSPWGSGHHPAKWMEYYDSCKFDSIPDLPDHPDLVTGPVYGTDKRRENLRGYFAAVSAMDEQVGRLLDVLKEKGLSEDTIVIFTSDNGMSMGQHGIWGKGNGTFPMNMYDTAVKVPFLMSVPGLTVPGSVCRSLISAYDLFPTLLDMTGLTDQMPEGLPGRSFMNQLTGQNRNSESESGEIVVYDEYGPVRMIRNYEWKYIHRYPYGPHELYHLSSDPEECVNLYDRPEYETVAVQMRKQLQQWFTRYSDPAVDGSTEGVTGSGQLCRAGIYASRTDTYAPIGS